MTLLCLSFGEKLVILTSRIIGEFLNQKCIRMKHVAIMILVFSSLFLGGLSAQDKDSSDDAARITFEKTLHDYGKIPFKGDGEYEFIFKNTGKSPLVINQVKSSCGCTVPTYPKEPIPANNRGIIKVKYDTKRQGPFSKSIVVTSNDPDGPVRLSIKGEVEKPTDQELKQMNFERRKEALARQREVEQKRKAQQQPSFNLEKEKTLPEKNE